jgi:hypothetical protein
MLATRSGATRHLASNLRSRYWEIVLEHGKFNRSSFDAGAKQATASKSLLQ